jgi:hypothetical protein
MNATFVKYVLSFYGKGGVYEMRNAEGKTPTAQLVRSLLPAMVDAMQTQGWNWGNGDSMDREFFREEVLAPLGYIN